MIVVQSDSIEWTVQVTYKMVTTDKYSVNLTASFRSLCKDYINSNERRLNLNRDIIEKIGKRVRSLLLHTLQSSDENGQFRISRISIDYFLPVDIRCGTPTPRRKESRIMAPT